MSREQLDSILTNIDQNHPERLRDEVFLINIRGDSNQLRQISWRTKRRGIIAYDTNDMRIENHFPVFIKKQEIEDD